jgi:hypothetical protein
MLIMMCKFADFCHQQGPNMRAGRLGSALGRLTRTRMTMCTGIMGQWASCSALWRIHLMRVAELHSFVARC